MQASFYPPRPPPPLAAQLLARLPALESYLESHHQGQRHLTWNNHASTRPKAYGGSLVRAVTEWKTYERIAPGSANALWRCAMDLRNNFAPNDGLQLQNLVRLPHKGRGVVRPKHWNISINDLLAGMPGTDIVVHHALPVHVAARCLDAGTTPAAPGARGARGSRSARWGVRGALGGYPGGGGVFKLIRPPPQPPAPARTHECKLKQISGNYSKVVQNSTNGNMLVQTSMSWYEFAQSSTNGPN